MEGGYLSNAAVERSKLRLQRLPYIESVEVETTPVPGSPDLVDVDFNDQGRPAGPVQRRHRLLRVAVRAAERQLRAQQLHGHRQPRRGRDQRRPVQQGLQPLAHRSLPDDRRRFAHAVGHLAQHHPVHQRLLGLRDRDRHAGRRLRLADLGVPVGAGGPRGPALRPRHRPERQLARGRGMGAQQRQHLHRARLVRRAADLDRVLRHRSSTRSR